MSDDRVPDEEFPFEVPVLNTKHLTGCEVPVVPDSQYLPRNVKHVHQSYEPMEENDCTIIENINCNIPFDKTLNHDLVAKSIPVKTTNHVPVNDQNNRAMEDTDCTIIDNGNSISPGNKTVNHVCDNNHNKKDMEDSYFTVIDKTSSGRLDICKKPQNNNFTADKITTITHNENSKEPVENIDNSRSFNENAIVTRNSEDVSSNKHENIANNACKKKLTTATFEVSNTNKPNEQAEDTTLNISQCTNEPVPIVIDEDVETDNDCTIINVENSPDTRRKNSKYNDVNNFDELLNENKLLAEIIDICLDMENSDGMLRIINRTLIPVYKNTDNAFKESEKFIKALSYTIIKLKNSPNRKFSHIKELCEILKCSNNKKRVTLTTLQNKVTELPPRRRPKKKMTLLASHAPKMKKMYDHNQSPIISLDDDEDDVIQIDCNSNTNIQVNDVNNQITGDKSSSAQLNEDNETHVEISVNEGQINTNQTGDGNTDDVILIDDEMDHSDNLNKENNTNNYQNTETTTKTVLSGKINENNNLTTFGIVPQDKPSSKKVKTTEPASLVEASSNITRTVEVIEISANEGQINTNQTGDENTDDVVLIDDEMDHSDNPNKENNTNNDQNTETTTKSVLSGKINENNYQTTFGIVPQDEPSSKKIKTTEPTSLVKASSNNTRTVEVIEKEIATLVAYIKELENKEVCNDDLDSPYVLCDSYKAKVVKLYKEICVLTGSVPVKRHTVRMKPEEGHHEGPMKFFEMFVNSNFDEEGNPIFPDLVDVINCVQAANMEYTLGWSKTQIEAEARALFIHYGRTAQKRRQYREWRHLMRYVKKEAQDPAEEDLELQARLVENGKIGLKNEEELLARYAKMEKSGPRKGLQVPDPETRRSIEDNDKHSDHAIVSPTLIRNSATENPNHSDSLLNMPLKTNNPSGMLSSEKQSNCEKNNPISLKSYEEAKASGSITDNVVIYNPWSVPVQAIATDNANNVQNILVSICDNFKYIVETQKTIEPIQHKNVSSSFECFGTHKPQAERCNKEINKSVVNSTTNPESLISYGIQVENIVANSEVINNKAEPNKCYEMEAATNEDACSYGIKIANAKMDEAMAVELPTDLDTCSTKFKIENVLHSNVISDLGTNLYSSSGIEIEDSVKIEKLSIELPENLEAFTKTIQFEDENADEDPMHSTGIKLEDMDVTEHNLCRLDENNGKPDEVTTKMETCSTSINIKTENKENIEAKSEENSNFSTKIRFEDANDSSESMSNPEPTSSEHDNSYELQIDSKTFIQHNIQEESSEADTNCLLVKRESLDIPRMLEQLGDDFTATIVGIEDPFMVIEISDSSDSESEED